MMHTTASRLHHSQHVIARAVATIHRPLVRALNALAAGVIAGVAFTIAVVSLVLAVLV